MMARKRIATSELNHDNWDEYESEEAGSFKKAPSNVLAGRIIKTAKRRSSASLANSDSPAKNVFSNFQGFNKSTGQLSPFAFLSSFGDPQNKSNGVNSTTSVSSSVESTSNSIFKMSENKPVSSENSANNKNEKSAEYYSKLKGLNESVSEWIKTHVDKNPLCVLTPIFKDYEKYLLEIEEAEKGNLNAPKTESLSTFQVEVKPTQVTSSVFGNIAGTASDTSKPTNTAEDTKGTTAPPPATKPAFSFGTLPSTTAAPATTGFTFGSGQPFTFTNVAKPDNTEKPSTAEHEEEGEEEDEPPKVEFTRIVEEGSVFSQRCKVFVKKDGSFGDRGVGQLFLKPVPGSEKIQLIVRADTNLGNLLLNFILSESTPMQRMGKNNVMLVSIPTPESKPPPTPILLRVKTAEEADELLKVLEKHKK